MPTVLLAAAVLAALAFVIDRVLRALSTWWTSFWGGLVEIATAAITTGGVVICVLGALATLVAIVYVIGTFAERMHRAHLYSRRQRERIAMEWDEMIMKHDRPASIGWDGPFPEDFDG
jgi:hypothetical protein